MEKAGIDVPDEEMHEILAQASNSFAEQGKTVEACLLSLASILVTTNERLARIAEAIECLNNHKN